MSEQSIIYNRLARIRTERGLSRDQLALVLGITPQLLGYIELEKYTPDLELALRISAFFGLHTDEIFSLAPLKSPRDVLA